MTTDIRRLHREASDNFGRLVRAVEPTQWAFPTPCAEWDVRTLVNHLVNESLWVAPLVEGLTVADVGAKFDGDLLGDDPSAAWEKAAANATAVFTSAKLGDTVHLSFGDTDVDDYCGQLVADLVLHGWDLARGIGADEQIAPALVDEVTRRFEPIAGMLEASGLFGTPITVAPDVDAQTTLLASVGRRA